MELWYIRVINSSLRIGTELRVWVQELPNERFTKVASATSGCQLMVTRGQGLNAEEQEKLAKK